MRVLIIILLLVLTPLRGWAADSMAMQMATQGMAKTAAIAISTPAYHCLEMAQHADDLADIADVSTSTKHPCSKCAFCQVCATVALLPPVKVACVSKPFHAPPWAPAVRFANADLSAGQKPPIS